MRKLCAIVVLAGAASLAAVLNAHAPSGAIFTTLWDGTEVNYNHYASKDLVYLDGGPGPGAPQTAAGLDDGRYVFQVTDPSGKRLLSTDKAKCRQFDVAGGVIDSVVVTGCEHQMGWDVDHPPARTVQLMPYADTPNQGGVYKVWVVRVEDFAEGCRVLTSTTTKKAGTSTGGSDGLELVDCGYNAGNVHGFVPAHSKTDNFKAKLNTTIREIDTRFFDDRNNDGSWTNDEPWIDGLSITWYDPLGASNRKTSYYLPELNINHEAHVEAIEDGSHRIEIADQPGCQVTLVKLDGAPLPEQGPQVVSVAITSKMKDKTIFIDVACAPVR